MSNKTSIKKAVWLVSVQPAFAAPPWLWVLAYLVPRRAFLRVIQKVALIQSPPLGVSDAFLSSDARLPGTCMSLSTPQSYSLQN